MDLFWCPTVFPFTRPLSKEWFLTVKRNESRCKVHENIKDESRTRRTTVILHTEWKALPGDVKLSDLLDDVTNGTNSYDNLVCECSIPLKSPDDILKHGHAFAFDEKYLKKHEVSRKTLDTLQLKVQPPGIPVLNRETFYVHPYIDFKFHDTCFQYRHSRYVTTDESVRYVIGRLYDAFQPPQTNQPITVSQLLRVSHVLCSPVVQFPYDLSVLVLEFLVSSSLERWV